MGKYKINSCSEDHLIRLAWSLGQFRTQRGLPSPFITLNYPQAKQKWSNGMIQDVGDLGSIPSFCIGTLELIQSSTVSAEPRNRWHPGKTGK